MTFKRALRLWRAGVEYCSDLKDDINELTADSAVCAVCSRLAQGCVCLLPHVDGLLAIPAAAGRNVPEGAPQTTMNTATQPACPLRVGKFFKVRERKAKSTTVCCYCLQHRIRSVVTASDVTAALLNAPQLIMPNSEAGIHFFLAWSCQLDMSCNGHQDQAAQICPAHTYAQLA